MSIHIRKPIMNLEGKRSVGVADYRLKYEPMKVKIEIDYITKKEKMRLYPNPFYIEKAKVLKYPTMYVQDTKLYIIPIEDLKEENNEN